MLLTMPSALWLVEPVVLRYATSWAAVLRPFLWYTAPLSFVAGATIAATTPVVLLLLVRYWRVGWIRVTCLLLASIASLWAAAMVWLSFLGLLTWHS
jgi:hypothetical protein